MMRSRLTSRSVVNVVCGIILGNSGFLSAYASSVSCPLASVAQVRKPDKCASQGGDYLSKRGDARIHGALDLNAHVGDKVFAVRDGVVAVASGGWGNLGNTVVIDHGDGNYSVYGHLETISVCKGHQVKAGESVGSVGYSGNAECLKGSGLPPHLHFAVLNAGKAGLANGAKPIATIESWAARWREWFYGDNLAVGALSPQSLLQGKTCWSD
jgi:murein DD-endopeptidase MepM/ murein hydrolase activator NlpD